MLFPWFQFSLLAIESGNVVALRLMKCTAGGRDAVDEAALMVSEKVDAAIEAGATLMNGGSALDVVDRYRQHVASNSRRLLAG